MGAFQEIVKKAMEESRSNEAPKEPQIFDLSGSEVHEMLQRGKKVHKSYAKVLGVEPDPTTFFEREDDK